VAGDWGLVWSESAAVADQVGSRLGVSREVIRLTREVILTESAVVVNQLRRRRDRVGSHLG
jgi:hypothetical protein